MDKNEIRRTLDKMWFQLAEARELIENAKELNKVFENKDLKEYDYCSELNKITKLLRMTMDNITADIKTIAFEKIKEKYV